MYIMCVMLTYHVHYVCNAYVSCTYVCNAYVSCTYVCVYMCAYTYLVCDIRGLDNFRSWGGGGGGGGGELVKYANLFLRTYYKR